MEAEAARTNPRLVICYLRSSVSGHTSIAPPATAQGVFETRSMTSSRSFASMNENPASGALPTALAVHSHARRICGSMRVQHGSSQIVQVERLRENAERAQAFGDDFDGGGTEGGHHHDGHS
jgi:hypothetical protein